MQNNGKLLASSRLRQLSPTQLTKICQMLDPSGTWKQFTARIKNRNRLPMFTNDQIWNIKEKCERSGQSPTRSVISSWCTDNPTIADLQDILMDIQFFRAADFINMDILKQPGPVRRPQKPWLQTKPDRPLEDTRTSQPRSPEDHLQIDYNSRDSLVPLQGINLMDLETPHSTEPVLPHEGDSTTVLKEPLAGDSLRRTDPSGPLCVSAHEEVTSPIRTDPISSIGNIQGLENFPILRLRQATDDFNTNVLAEGGRVLGEGGFGKVFKGELEGYRDMAIKCLSPEVFRESGPLAMNQFKMELEVLATCCHENMLSLLGYCDTQTFCLVYEYMPNGSLEERLACKNGTEPLSIKQRLSVVEGVASGLNYLHNFTPPFIHRDIKSANVLLDKDFTAKIGDCGTVRLGPKDMSKTVTITDVFVGTRAYMAPEYLEAGQISVKLDSYSYGVVLLEILTGLAPADENREDRLLPTHIKETLDSNEDIHKFVDPKVGPWIKDLVMKIYTTTLQLLSSRRKRPTISDILPDIESWAAQYKTESKC